MWISRFSHLSHSQQQQQWKDDKRKILRIFLTTKGIEREKWIEHKRINSHGIIGDVHTQLICFFCIKKILSL